MIRDAGIAREQGAKLPYGYVSGPFERVEIALTATKARAYLATRSIEVEGDMELVDLDLRPRDPQRLHAWIQVHRVIPRVVTGSSVQGEVPLPHGLSPTHLDLTLPCAALTFASPPERPYDAKAEWIELVPGSAPLLDSPGGSVIATISSRAASDDTPFLTGSEAEADDEQPVHARVLERRGEMLRVRFDDSSMFQPSNIVEGWVAASATRSIQNPNIYGGLLGTQDPITVVRCREPIPVFARVGWDPTQVGRVVPDAELRVGGDLSAREVPIELGRWRSRLFVRGADLADCTS